MFKGIKSFFRENYKTIIFLLVFYIIIRFPVPYYVFTSGGITDLSQRFELDGRTEQEGSYNLSYVSQVDGNVLTYLISKFIPSWELAKIEDYQVSSNESLEEMATRDKLSLTAANQTAVVLAYTKANKEIIINSTSFYVIGTYDFFESNIHVKIGDKLLKVDDIEVNDFSDISTYIASKEVGDTVDITFLRNDKEVVATCKVKKMNETNVVGLAFYQIHDMTLNPEIKFTFSDSESGSSAGLMTTLAIYDALVEDDLTNGLKIAGTGTIDINGNVGEIGGVTYKLSGAVQGGADIFFVPRGANYRSALKAKEEKGYDIEIVEVETFDDAVDYLNNLKNEKE